MIGIVIKGAFVQAGLYLFFAFVTWDIAWVAAMADLGAGERFWALIAWLVASSFAVSLLGGIWP